MRFIPLSVLILAVALPGSAPGLDLGGELRIHGGGLYSENELLVSYSGRGELELFFPESETVETRLVFRAALTETGVLPDIKYMYIRPLTGWGHITAGRQPVFWSYGAVLNLMDFGLGIEDLAEETFRTGVDGVRVHRALGGGRSLQLAVSVHEFAGLSPGDMGYGTRLRLPGRGYDLSFNLLWQPVFFPVLPEADDRLIRAGGTFSTDAGGVGVYGALGYFHLRDNGESDLMAQAGTDYSWVIGGRPLIFQAEYFRFLENNLSAGLLAGLLTGGGTLEDLWLEEEGYHFRLGDMLLGSDLLLISLVLRPDFFTDLGVLLLAETENRSVALSPYYITEMGNGLELRFYGNLSRDTEENYAAGLFSAFYYYF